MIVEVNGVKYIKREAAVTRGSARMHTLTMAAIAMGGLMMGGKREPERPEVDIVKEYKLIQNKKSRLTKSQRDWVVSQFKYNYTKIEK